MVEQVHYTYSLFELKEKIRYCDECKLVRKSHVFYEGDEKARYIFIGEAPGYEEDAQGRPFVGQSGQKLNEWLMMLKLKREEVLITNSVVCRPPNNQLSPSQLSNCKRVWFENFLRLVTSRVPTPLLITLGEVALTSTAGIGYSLKKLGLRYSDALPGVRLFSLTPIPAYILKSGMQLGVARALQQLKEIIVREGGAKQ